MNQINNKEILFNNYKQIVLENRPLLDVRAPIEYEKGAFPNSTNIPILNDEEREKVGICYKKKGNDEAVKLGHELVSGDIKEARLQAWIDFIEANPSALLYCFRGGSRSQITRSWLAKRGVDIERMEGGYKAFRTFLLDEITGEFDPTISPITLGGHTGSGKTLVIKRLKNSIDLEGLANHRGSSFGHNVTPQPTQINFDNELAYEMIRFKEKGLSHLVVEDEGRNIGRIFMNFDFFNWFRSKYMVILESTFEERIENTYDDYVTKTQGEYIDYYGEIGLEKWYEYIKSSMIRVKKRLGLERLNVFLEQFESAYKHQLNTGEATMHKTWIASFLRDYYDPMYSYQIDTSDRKLLFKGNSEEVVEFLNSLK